jgi:hypothetical protein
MIISNGGEQHSAASAIRWVSTHSWLATLVRLCPSDAKGERVMAT